MSIGPGWVWQIHDPLALGHSMDSKRTIASVLNYAQEGCNGHDEVRHRKGAALLEIRRIERARSPEYWNEVWRWLAGIIDGLKGLGLRSAVGPLPDGDDELLLQARRS